MIDRNWRYLRVRLQTAFRRIALVPHRNQSEGVRPNRSRQIIRAQVRVPGIRIGVVCPTKGEPSFPLAILRKSRCTEPLDINRAVRGLDDLVVFLDPVN